MSEGSRDALPRVTAIVACRNEEPFIGRCLESLVTNDYPKDRLEVLVVDGISEDGTREIIAQYASNYSFVRLLDNRAKHATAAFNIGVISAKGEIIMIMGSHATYDRQYIPRAVHRLLSSKADNVGGVLKIVPRTNSLWGKAIAATLSSRLASGNAYTKIGSKQPRWVDTVFGGCYHRSVFERIGLFDERLVRSQDIDFNRRLRKAGGRILLDSGIVATYFARSGLLEFWRSNYSDGFWTFFPLRFGKQTFALRHLAPLGLVSTLLALSVVTLHSPAFAWALGGTAGAYSALGFASAIHITYRERDLRFLPVVPLVFAVRHLAWGVGSLVAIVAVAANYMLSKTTVFRPSAQALDSVMKRLFDMTAASVALAVLSPLLIAIAVGVKLETPGPAFYRGTRIGRLGRPFRMFKFRTMVVDADRLGGPSTANDDPRITRFGRLLRRYKLDELPQLINVLKGEMSIVGPRPEVPHYIDMLTEPERVILSVHPGMTDWASIWNPDEGALLAGSDDPERAYLEQIRPTKIRLQVEYVRRRSFWVDLGIIYQTLATLTKIRVGSGRGGIGRPEQ